MSYSEWIWEDLGELRAALDRHPVYGMLRSVEDLRCFMEHHVYSVWDFMSLVKTLQAAVAPARAPWLPVGDPKARRFINAIVLEEESDWADPAGEGFLSHFELYCGAMREVGAEPRGVLAMLDRVAERGIGAALDSAVVPAPARRFMRATFGFIVDGKPHLAAAALACGREHVIPEMFRRFLAGLGIDAAQAPTFHFYLKRHIHLDEDFHAPLSLRLLEHLCGNDAVRREEAREAARAALQARIELWDGVAAAIEAGRRAAA